MSTYRNTDQSWPLHQHATPPRHRGFNVTAALPGLTVAVGGLAALGAYAGSKTEMIDVEITPFHLGLAAIAALVVWAVLATITHMIARTRDGRHGPISDPESYTAMAAALTEITRQGRPVGGHLDHPHREIGR